MLRHVGLFALFSVGLLACGGKGVPTPDSSLAGPVPAAPTKAGENAKTCPAPSAEVAGAFAAIDHPDLVNLDEYLDAHPVAKTARNEKCETLYFRAIRVRNDADRAVLETRGYAPDLKAADDELKVSAKDYALAHGSIATLESFAKGDFDPAFDLSYDEAFSKLLAGNSRDVVAWALRHDHPNLDAEWNRQQRNYLVFAIEKARPKAILELLIAAGAPVEILDATVYDTITQESPLQTASRTGHRDAVVLLLSKRAKTGHAIGHDRHKALFSAIEIDRADIVELLIEGGANLNASEPAGEVRRVGFESRPDYVTALQFARNRGKTAAAAMLVKYGAIAAVQGPYGAKMLCPTPRPRIRRAFDLVAGGDAAGLKSHLETNPISIDAANSGCEPLYLAAIRSNRPDVVSVLEAAGYAYNERTPVIDLYRGGIAKDSERNFENFVTPLEWLTVHGNQAMFEYFEKKDPNGYGTLIWRGDVNFQMELWAAASNRNPEIAEFFLARYTPNPKGWMHNEPAEILSAAASGSNLPWVKAMLAHGTPVDSPADWGRTALMSAAMSGSAETIQVLLAAGAVKDAKDYMGNSAYAHAKSKNRPAEILALLK